VAQGEAEKKGTEAEHYQHHLESELETAQRRTQDLLSQVDAFPFEREFVIDNLLVRFFLLL
jgi:hypothetical protein